MYHPEVALEYTSQALGGKDRADYVLLDGDSNPAVVVEAKQEGAYLSGHKGQLKRYMRNFGAKLGILTKGESFIFLCSDDRSDVPEEVELLSCELEDIDTALNILDMYTQEGHVGTDRSQSVVDLARNQFGEEFEQEEGSDAADQRERREKLKS